MNRKKTMSDTPEKKLDEMQKPATTPLADFKLAAVSDLKKEERVKAALGIILQDFYLFLSRLSVKKSPEWFKIDEMLENFDRDSILTEMFVTQNEGAMNRRKDKAIRELMLMELLREYMNYRKTKAN